MPGNLGLFPNKPIGGMLEQVNPEYMSWIYCLPEAGDIVTLPMKSVSLVVAYSSMLFPKLFQASHGSSQSPLDCLSPFGKLAPLEAMRLFFS